MKGHVPDTPRLFTGLIAIINPDLTLFQAYNLPKFSFANEIYLIWTELDKPRFKYQVTNLSLNYSQSKRV